MPLSRLQGRVPEAKDLNKWRSLTATQQYEAIERADNEWYERMRRENSETETQFSDDEDAPLSPPPTPPQCPKKIKRKNPDRVQKPQKPALTSKEIRRLKRKAPRRPRTRSMSLEPLALHSRKGYVIVKQFFGDYVARSYNDYWENYVSRNIKLFPQLCH